MIGGVDVFITTRAGAPSLIAAARAIRQSWPDAVFENATTGERYSSYWETPFDCLEEVFVYRDAHAADLWDNKGAIQAAYNSMIHLISEQALTTVVADDPEDPAIKEMVEAIRSVLRNDIFNTVAELEAA